MGEALAEAFVRVRPETAGFRQALTGQLRGDIRQSERDLQRFTRGTIVGTGALHGLGRAAAFASTAFIGGAGLTYAIRSSIKEATDQTQILANLRNSLQASGFSWREYGARIQDATNKTKAISAFDDEELFRSLQLLIRGTGDVSKALKLNALAADVARGRNLGLVQSAQLLVRVNAGNIGSLRRLGIVVDKNATSVQALAAVQRQYAGAAEAYGKTAAGVQARLSVAIQDTEKAIGRALLPTIVKLETRLADWLGKTRNQERVQRDVEQAVRDATQVVSAFASVVHGVTPVVKSLTGAVGGLGNTVKLASAAFVTWKLAGLITGMGRLGSSAKLANAETRALAGNLGRLKAFGVIGVTVAVAFEIGKYGRQFSDFLGGTSLGKALGAGNSQFSASEITGAVAAGKIDAATLEKLRSTGLLTPGAYAAGVAALKKQGNLFGGGLSPVFSPNPPAVRGQRPEDLGTILGPSGGSALLGQRARIQQALDAAAATSKSTVDDVKALTDERVFLGKQIEAERRRLETATTAKQAQKYADNLHNLEQQATAAFGQIQAIEDQNAADAKAKADKAAAAAKRAADARERAYLNTVQITETNLRSTQRASQYSTAANTRLLGFYRKEEHDQRLSGVARADFRAKAIGEVERERHADASFRAKIVAVLQAGQKSIEAARKAGREAGVKAQEARAKAAQTALSVREGRLTLARQAADLAVARAGDDQGLLDKAAALEKKADQALIKFYKERIAATKGLARQNYQQQLLAAQLDLANLSKKTAGGGSFTLSQLYQEAESEYKLYGSNYGGRGTPLSPQQERGAFSSVVLKGKGSVHVTQNFFSPTRPSQAMNDARSGARYLN